MREKLIELLKQMGKKEREQGGVTWFDVADHLIANGVVISDLETPTMQKWIPVTERLPETDNENTHAFDVLVYIPKREGCRQHGIYIGKLKSIKADDGSGNFWGLPIKECDWTVWGWSYFSHPVVTHWMPLPEPPKGE